MLSDGRYSPARFKSTRSGRTPFNNIRKQLFHIYREMMYDCEWRTLDSSPYARVAHFHIAGNAANRSRTTQPQERYGLNNISSFYFGGIPFSPAFTVSYSVTEDDTIAEDFYIFIEDLSVHSSNVYMSVIDMNHA